MKFRLRVLKNKKSVGLSSRDDEIIVRPLGLSKKSDDFLRRERAKITSERWTKHAVRQLKSKFEVAFQSREPKPSQKSSQEAVKVAVTFDGGGEARYLMVPDTMTENAVQTRLRDSASLLLKKAGDTLIRVDVRELLPDRQRNLISYLGSLSEMVFWSVTKFGRAPTKKKVARARDLELLSDLDAKEVESLFLDGQLLGRSNNMVRTLANLPSNKLTPSAYVQFIEKRARERKYQIQVLGKRQLLKLKAGAFLAVIQGSMDGEGALVHLKYTPKVKGKKKGRVVLVGKGLCFDTGGHNIKTGPHMFGMHRDMTGSAVALGLFETLVEKKVPCEVHAVLCLAENLISTTSFRPNDVVTALDGTSIEVVDTDAEGRMVLADGLAYARRLKPDLVLDFATLTGAAVRAIGTKRCAVFSNREELLTLARECGDRCGERVWGFPIGDEYMDLLKSDVADILQCTLHPSPDHIVAATFLSRFVGDEVPWIHCDLSAEESKGGLGLVDSDTSGFGVRWGYHVVKRLCKTGVL